MAGPADWGAIPITDTPQDGPLAWGAIPVGEPPKTRGRPWEAYGPSTGPWTAYQQKPSPGMFDDLIPKGPTFGSDEYVKSLARKHGADPDQVRALVEAEKSGQFLKGIPIAGGFVDKAGAGISALAAPLTGAGVPGQSITERYGKNLALMSEVASDYERAHPVLSTVSQLGGGVLATGGLGATATGAKLLGITGGGLGRQVGASVLSGAGINVADALVRGNDPGTAAAIGGGFGVAGPLAARGIGMAADAARRIINPAEGAARVAGPAFQQAQDLAALTPGVKGNPLTPAQFHGAIGEGSPVTVMETMGEPGERLARAAANINPEAAQLLNKTLDERFLSQPDRFVDKLRTMQHYPDAVAQQRALEQSQTAANNVNYRKAMQDGDRSIWSPDLERLASSPAVMEAMQKATKAVGNEAVIGGYAGMNPKFSFTPDGRLQPGRGPTGAPIYPNLQFWDMTRKQLSDAANQAEMRGQDTAFRQLSVLSQHMNAALDAQVPSYAAARAGHEFFAGAKDALQAGRNFLTSAVDNREAAAAKLRMSPLERQVFEDGFADSLIKQIRAIPDKNDVAAKIGNSQLSREKLAIGLGSEEKARQFEALLHLEGLMSKTRQAVQGNSTTARQLNDMNLLGNTINSAVGAYGAYGAYQGDPAAMAHAALIYGLKRGANAVQQRQARQVAELLTSQDLPRVRMGMRMLGANQGLLGNLRAASTALARSTAVQTEPDNQRKTVR